MLSRIFSICSILVLAAIAQSEEHGLFASYRALAGDPAVSFTRVDAQVDFAWASGGPASDFPNDNFTVRWSGWLVPDVSGQYRIGTVSDDGVQLWLDRRLVVENWTNHGDTRDEVRMTLEAGRAYPVDLQFYEHSGQATAQLWWALPGQEPQAVPQANLMPQAPVDDPGYAPGHGAGLRLTTFASDGFGGASSISVAPLGVAPGFVPADPIVEGRRWSCIWDGELEAPESAEFTLTAAANAQVQVWIDGELELSRTDRWANRALNSRPLTWVSGSRHRLSVRYAGARDGYLQLWWSTPSHSPTLVPRDRQYPSATVAPVALSFTEGSASSRVNPAWIAGTAATGATLAASLDGVAIAVLRRGGDSWSIAGADANEGVPLVPGQVRRLEIAADRAAIAQEMTWASTDLSDTYGIDPTVIRCGDSLLVTASDGSGELEIDRDHHADAGFAATSSGVVGDRFPLRFTQPGSFVVAARIAGQPAGHLTVHVVAAGITEGLAAQVGFRREKLVTASHPGLVTWSTSDAAAATSETLEATSAGARLGVRPLALQAGDLVARLASPPYAVVARRRVDGFIVRTTAERSVPVIETLADGTLVGQSTIFLTPALDDLEIVLQVFVSGVVFDDGGLRKVIASGDFVPDAWSPGRSRIDYLLLRSPGSTSGLCHSLVAYQYGVQVSY